MALERSRLDGKVAIVTGGAKGVGRGVAGVLAEAGAAVVVMSRTRADVDAAVESIRAEGGRAAGFAGDVLTSESRERLVRTALDEFGRLDIVVNNAGGARPARFQEITEDKFMNDFRFNVVQAFLLSQMAVPHMMKNEEGAIVNISSRASSVGTPEFLTYSVVKAALEQLTVMMARNLAPKIRVNAISLGMVMTDALRRHLSASEVPQDKLLDRIPLHRIGEVEDVGLAALYLCSRNCYVTGHVLNIDGGRS